MRYEIRPSVAEDFLAFYGSLPQKSCRAWTVIYDGDIAAIAGVTISRDALMFFSDIAPDREYPASTIYKVGCFVTERVHEMGLPVMAIGDDDSHNFLTRLGFYEVGCYNDQRFYKLWRASD